MIIQAALKRSRGDAKLFLENLPDKIKGAPEILPGLEIYYEAFTELSACRQSGMGIGAIPWTALDRWAERYGLTEEEFERLAIYIRMMDAEYIKYVSKKQNS